MTIDRVRLNSREFETRRQDVIDRATNAGWRLEQEQRVSGLLIFTKNFDGNVAIGGDVQMNVYVTTMNVATSMNHPRRGRTQLFRHEVSMRLLSELLKNPRLHTQGRGYYRTQKRRQRHRP